jgi:hypothetical protein
MDREMQTSLHALCALDHVNWHVIAREAQQPLGLERLLDGQLTETSKQARETQKLIAGASGDLAKQRLRAVEEIRRAEDAGAKLVTVLDDDYPAKLRVIYNSVIGTKTAASSNGSGRSRCERDHSSEPSTGTRSMKSAHGGHLWSGAARVPQRTRRCVPSL